MEEHAIRTDIFQYDKAFLAYKSCNNDHERLSRLNHTFLKQLQDLGLFYRQDQVTLVGDIGCGDGEATITYLNNIEFKGGLDIRAMDKLAQFAGTHQSSVKNATSEGEKGLANETFSKAKQSQVIPLKNYQVNFGDMLEVDVAHLLYTDEEIKESMNRFNLVYLSHSVYYARDQHKNGRYGVTNLLDSVATDLLADDGVAILFHAGLEFDTFTSIGYYTRSLIQNIVPTEEEYNRLSATHVISNSSRELGLTYFEIPYKFELYFSKDCKKYADVFKDPSRYHELQNDPAALQDLYKIIFIAHRSPDDLYTDHSSRGLNNLVDKVLDCIKRNGSIIVSASMQVILSRKASDEFKQKIETAVKECQNKFGD
ncbi:hypothetical protein TrispH2_011261 [Trichoplax sp. H2]|nr:hypothetical protein TrispH2_011261 [Trichoplax sp. H2]|eukprot:RDD36787.1 hypothetical protein TrispH2_011261 [Trichoplax sp. H2]